MNEQQAKALFFAQYLGQKVYTCTDWQSFSDKRPNVVDSTYLQQGSNRLNQGYLLLRSVNQLTDEEAIILVNLVYASGAMTKNCTIKRSDNYWEFIKISNKEGYVSIGIDVIRTGFNRDMSLESKFGIVVTDYLRSIGILLPFTYIDEAGKPITLQPDEIIKKGWAKYQTIQTDYAKR